MKSITRSLALALFASLLIIPAAASATERRVALGISEYDVSHVTVLDRNINAVEQNKAAVGRYPAIWAIWSDWGGPDKDFPSTFVSQLHDRGITPMFNWEPTNPNNPFDCNHFALQNTLNGDFYTYIRDWATAAKSFGHTILLRLAHEMNGNWFVWGENLCTNGDGAKYKLFWRYVWNIFQDVGATNVKFLWSIYGAHRIKAYYPGDAYVNYIGFTAFNWGPNPVGASAPWSNNMVNHFQGPIKAIRKKISKTIPMIAAEMGSAPPPANCSTCSKTKYIANGYPNVYAKWPQLVAIVYFDVDTRPSQQPDWRLSSPPSALAAYAAIAAQSRFQGTIP